MKSLMLPPETMHSTTDLAVVDLIANVPPFLIGLPSTCTVGGVMGSPGERKKICGRTW